MVIDVITFNGEHELFEIRYNVLKDYVDEFRVIEFDKTFSEKPKEPTFKYQDWPKVKYYLNAENVWGKYEELARKSPNTQYGKGAGHWITEFCQKESIKDCLADLKDDDLVFIGDCDEIWNPTTWESEEPELPELAKLKLRVYTYWLNQRSSEQFWGTIAGEYKYIRDRCLNELRSSAWKTKNIYGYHFTSIARDLHKKLTDSYTEESYATKAVLDNLKENIENNKDFLGRDFTYRIDESEWPQYLKDNKKKYQHLCL